MFLDRLKVFTEGGFNLTKLQPCSKQKQKNWLISIRVKMPVLGSGSWQLKSGPSKVGGRRRFVAASNQSHRRLLFAES